MNSDALLTGLDGTNPMGFLAALGALVIADQLSKTAALAWTHSVLPVASLHRTVDIDDLIEAILGDRDIVISGPALTYETDGSTIRDVKFIRADQTKRYLQTCAAHNDPRHEAVAVAFVAETSLDEKGKAKPTDLHFTAGNQHLLDMARKLGEAVTADRLREALLGPWRYRDQQKSFMWDITDDRVYALSAVNPATNKKPTVPGADWLAFRGLTLLPVVGQRGRTLTPGAGGSWKRGFWTWPLWDQRLDTATTRMLLAQMPRPANDAALTWTPPTDVFRVMRSAITRSAQGGYGTIRPPRIIWERPQSRRHGQLNAADEYQSRPPTRPSWTVNDLSHSIGPTIT